MARGVGVGLFEGGNYFQYFHLRGADSQREAINRRTAIIPGNTVSFSFLILSNGVDLKIKIL